MSKQITNEKVGANQKLRTFELKDDGSVEKVGPFGAYGPTVKAINRTEAMAKFLSFAFRTLTNNPKVKLRNGAYQLSYEGMQGINVEAGIEGRGFALCCSGVAKWSDLNDQVASFDYYASADYQQSEVA